MAPTSSTGCPAAYSPPRVNPGSAAGRSHGRVAAFVGVLGVAIIAAATAQWRQWAEHKHDRAMRDLDDLRIVLDHGYDAADGALRSLADARDAIRRHIDSKVTAVLPSFTAEHLASWSPEQHERHREQLEQVTEGMEDVIEPLAERSGEHITEVALFSRRLAIRRGPDDPVTKDLVAVLGRPESDLERHPGPAGDAQGHRQGERVGG
jgi:hypothetical protein